MKKTKVFFMTLLIAIALLGFSGRSLAFDLSSITSKPVEFFKYVSQKLGFGDSDEEKSLKAKPVKTLTVKQSTKDIPILQTKVGYLNVLPWESFSQINTELFLESTLPRQSFFESYILNPEKIYRVNPGIMDYGFRINALVENAKIGLYGWHGNHADLLGTASLLEAQDAASDLRWTTGSGYNQESDNIAATVSYELPLMRYLHQGMSPTVRLEAAYRSGADEHIYSNLIENYDQWKIGMAYEGSNHVDWLNPYGINWGVGYIYTVVPDGLSTMDNLKRGYSSYSGNVNANTYWFNMKLNTMFMYLYDRQTRGSMTVLNATYSPDWRWSYGIKANFYHGKKDGDTKELKSISELVTTFTATYRWD